MSDDSSGYRVRPNADAIPCPFLTTAYNNGKLVPTSNGTLDQDAIERAMAAYGISERLRSKLAKAVVKKDGDDSSTTLNLFKLRDSGLDHTGSTGIRDPKVDADKLPDLLAFGENGRMYSEHFARATSHHAREDPGVKGTVQQTMDIAALLEVFGRRDGDGAPYLTDEDISGLWLEGRHPEGWEPPPADSIGGSDVFGGLGLMCAERFVQRLKDLI